MGITTGRQTQKKSMPPFPSGVPASFQSLQEMMSLEQYKDMADRMKDFDESNDSTNDRSRDRLIKYTCVIFDSIDSFHHSISTTETDRTLARAVWTAAPRWSRPPEASPRSTCCR